MKKKKEVRREKIERKKRGIIKRKRKSLRD